SGVEMRTPDPSSVPGPADTASRTFDGHVPAATPPFNTDSGLLGRNVPLYGIVLLAGQLVPMASIAASSKVINLKFARSAGEGHTATLIRSTCCPFGAVSLSRRSLMR